MRHLTDFRGIGYIRRHSKGLLVVCAIVAAVAAVMAVVHSLDAPAYGTITSPARPPASSASSSPKLYSGKYANFKVPAHFAVTAGQLSASYLEVNNLTSTDHTSTSAAIVVYRGALGNDSGMNYRRGHPELYAETTVDGNPVFSKTQNGSEYTGYLAHDGLVASISFSSSYGRNLKPDYVVVARSWQWK